MDPITAIVAAKVGSNILQNVLGPGQPPQQAQPPVDPVAFQQLLTKAASSPEIQSAALLNAEGIQHIDDAKDMLGDLGNRVLQDPDIQRFISGNGDPVDVHYQADGSVKIRLSDGRSRSFKLAGDAQDAAERASRIVDALNQSKVLGTDSATSVAKQLAGVNIIPGGAASFLFASHL